MEVHMVIIECEEKIQDIQSAFIHASFNLQSATGRIDMEIRNQRPL